MILQISIEETELWVWCTYQCARPGLNDQHQRKKKENQRNYM